MKKNTKGITLITLVVTIIVLLILAGVSISMLTGQNGILTQAQKAKDATEQSGAKEKVELAVIGAKANDRTLTVGKLRTELANYGGTVEGNAFPVTTKIDGRSFIVNDNGKVLSEENGTLGIATGNEKSNTTVKDSLGNQVVVPAGFKVVNPDDNVINGIIVEDVSHSATSGSQFVWIPVGDVIKDTEGNKETIKLSRYTFANDNVGTPTDQGANEIENSSYSIYKHTETNTSTNGNTIAKENIESEESGFRKSAKDNHGYYIGRYEARKNGTQVTVKGNDKVYNNITQPEAAKLSRKMYSDSNFESDLINSYAWDTAIVFLQKFDNRENKDDLKPYSRQNSLNNSLENQGTNSLEDTSKQDIICNVWDLASNCWEWTTENVNDISYPCSIRGGYSYDNNSQSSSRYNNNTQYSVDGISFRLLIYIN